MRPYNRSRRQHDGSLSARDVVERILPDASDRWTVLDRLNRSSKFAASIAPAVLSVRLGNSGFRINVGQVEVLTFFNDTFRILLAANKTDERLARLQIVRTTYKSIRGPQCYFVGTVSDYRAAKEQIDSLHEEYIRNAATTINGSPRQGTPFAVHHSEDLITYARKYVSTSAQSQKRKSTPSAVENGKIPQNFVAYHNVDERGSPLHRGRRGWFQTNRPTLPRKGDVLWCFEGEGRPKKYALVKRAVVAISERELDGTSVVRYQYSELLDVIVNDAPWFIKLRKSQGSFAFGVNRINDPDIVNELERYSADQSQSSIESDIADIKRDRSIPDTTRKALIDARRGQGGFRRDLDLQWGYACAVTSCTLRDLLRASHIKPWRYSTHEERLDPANGLLLLANIDILFDRGFLSFDDSGRMLISSRLSTTERRTLRLSGRLRQKPDAQQRIYLAQHRKAFGFPDQSTSK